jgi:hypothetical protein
MSPGQDAGFLAVVVRMCVRVMVTVMAILVVRVIMVRMIVMRMMVTVTMCGEVSTRVCSCR